MIEIKRVGTGIAKPTPITNSTQEFMANKHLKGYIYDSLVYRYIRAREAMAERDWSLHKEHDKGFYYRQANRDIMRFCQILDEAIGEHD